MRHIVLATTAALAVVACSGSQTGNSQAGGREQVSATDATAGGEAAGGREFALRDSDTAESARGATASKIKPSATEAAMKFIVVDKDKGPIRGVVIAMTAPDGTKYYTQETDTEGYAEVLVPVGQKYELVYLSLGRRDIAATVPVGKGANQNIKLTLRYKFLTPPPAVGTAGQSASAEPRFVLDGVQFDVGKANVRAESFPRLDSVAEYMAHKPSSRIEISGHSDNAGNAKTNKKLSEKRAQACRDYLIAKGIDPSRIEAVGYGDERPIAPNDTEAGRQQNRRIEATEL